MMPMLYPHGGEAGLLDLALHLRQLPVERHERGGAHVEPLIMGPSRWEEALEEDDAMAMVRAAVGRPPTSPRREAAVVGDGVRRHRSLTG